MKKGERRKRELLQIAYKLFLSRGYENTSVDEIIEVAGIAKGTYYYYFESKEQMLEDVIGMMIEAEAGRARQVLASQADVPQKIVGIIASLRPAQDERSIDDALNRPENVLMHDKIRKRLLSTVVPLLSEELTAGTVEISALTTGAGSLRLTLTDEGRTVAAGEAFFEDGEAAAELAVSERQS